MTQRPSLMPYEAAVIGGGIAGLSTAWHLLRKGVRELCVIERDWTYGVHASGSNAAIFRQYDGNRATVRLAHRSRELMQLLEPSARLVNPIGAVYFGGAFASRRLRAALDLAGAPHRPWAQPPSHSAGRLALAADEEGVYVPGDGLIDVHALLQGLVRALHDQGVTLRLREEVVAIDRKGRPKIFLAGGETISTNRVVLAAGAWSQELSRRADLELPFLPRRRHLFYLKPPQPLAPGHPVIWDTHGSHEVYFRREAAGVLASPCDSTAWRPGVPPTDPKVVLSLAERLGRLSPKLAESEVVRSWACLRTFAPDRELVVGRDPRDPRFTWCAGLGGRGMTCGLAAGEAAAAAALGRDAGGPSFSPGRLFDARAARQLRFTSP